MFYDYVIVGGGLSGATLGYLLQQKGFSVIILEKQTLKSKYKVCAGVLTTKTYDILINLFPQEEIDNLITNHYTSVLFKINSSFQQCVNNIDLRIVERKELDDYVINKYLSINGKIFEKCKITEINLNDNYLIANNNIIYYNHLIGADGCFSQVRKCLTGVQQNYLFGFESFQEKISVPVSMPIVEINPHQIGYNLIMPVKNTILLGSCDLSSKEKNIAAYQEMIESYGGQFNNRKGGFLPVGNDILLQQNNIYLVGDAAGLIHPFTGEGMYYALSSVIALYSYFINDKITNYEQLLKPQLNTLKLQNKIADYLKTNPGFCLKLLQCTENRLSIAVQGLLDQ